jgi:hypothetical protein
MPELAGILKKNGELAITEETEAPWYFFYQVSFLQEERELPCGAEDLVGDKAGHRV